jgi:hypothetical protein
VYYLHLVLTRDAHGCWFVNILFIRALPNHQDISLYLTLDDEICLNALLSVGLLPSTSAHLFWNQDIDLYEYLEACSHQWKVLPPSIVGNTLMSPDRWIIQVLDLNTLITLVECNQCLETYFNYWWVISRLLTIYLNDW